MQAKTRELIIREIGARMMKDDNAPLPFVIAALKAAMTSKAVFLQLQLWDEFADHPEDQAEVLADIQEYLDARSEDSEKAKRSISEDVTLQVIKDVMELKDRMRAQLEAEGVSLKELSERTGMASPSLSRFFNTASRPRRTTLRKIAEAMDWNEADIASDWAT